MILCLVTSVDAQDVQYYYTQAGQAKEAKDYEVFYINIGKAAELHPYHQGIMYQKGIACALTGRNKEAVESLEQAIAIDNRFDLQVEELQPLRSLPEFQTLLKTQQEFMKPFVTSDTALVIPNLDSHFESLAYDPFSQSFFLGSINKRKVIKVNAAGEVADFINKEDLGMSSVFGIRIDPNRNILWVCSSPMPEMENYDSTLHSVVFKFDLNTAELLDKYEDRENSSIFGDLLIGPEGKVYVSDSKNNKILIVNENTKKLETFFESEEFWNIQGISVSSDGIFMLVSDYIKGPFHLNIVDKKLTKMTSSMKQSLKGIDGLLLHDGSFIGIQNGVNPFRTVRYFLSSDHTSIVDSQIIDWMHPAFGEPTMGQIVNGTLYYLANSQWGAYDQSHQFKKEEAQNIIILKYKLSN